jgi:hypothetical protein
MRVAARHRRAGIRDNKPVRRPKPLQGRLGGRQYLQRGRLRQVQRRYLHLSSIPYGLCRRWLDSGLDAGVVEHGRLVYWRHDANAHSTASHSDTRADANTGANAISYANAGANANTGANANAGANANSYTAADWGA